jgi:hypothetical protein
MALKLIPILPHSKKRLKKLNVYPRTDHEGPEGEQRYTCTLSLTMALDGGGWSTPRPRSFTAGKQTRYPLCRRLDGPQVLFGRVRKILPLPGFYPRTVQPVVSRYTDAILAHPTHQTKRVICRPENPQKSFNHHPPYTHFFKVESSLQDFPLSLRYMSRPNHQS